MKDNIREILLQPKFIETLLVCADTKELVEQYDRLNNSNLSLKGSTLDLKIDEATGRLDYEVEQFVIFVYEYIYQRIM